MYCIPHQVIERRGSDANLSGVKDTERLIHNGADMVSCLGGGKYYGSIREKLELTAHMLNILLRVRHLILGRALQCRQWQVLRPNFPFACLRWYWDEQIGRRLCGRRRSPALTY